MNLSGLFENLKYFNIGANAIIVLFGILVWCKLKGLHGEALEIKKKAEDKSKDVKGKEILDLANNMMGYYVQNNNDPTAMDDSISAYSEVSGKFDAWTQSISLFPLLGLLGTVCGIIPGLSGTAESFDIGLLQQSLSTALYTTFTGLICSIVLKGTATKYSITFSSIEDYFDMFDRKYNIALNFRRVKESSEKEADNN